MAKRRRLKKKVKIALVLIAAVLVIGVIAVPLIFEKDEEPKVDEKEKKDPMTELYYYDESRHDRYLEYAKVKTDLPIEDIVWQVNVDLDKDPYTDMITIDESVEHSNVLLVNKHFRLRDEYEPKNMVLYRDYYYMTQETYANFMKMQADAKKEGLELHPGSTYRSISYQKDLYNSYVEEDGVEEADTYSARAGSSEHHTGRAIDLVGYDWSLRSFCGTDEAEWVLNNAYKYGFIVRYQEQTEYITGYIDEPWHITYIGVNPATIMHENNIDSLEEYYVKYVMYSPDQNS